jgi:broad specificity phosphatase PhoE
VSVRRIALVRHAPTAAVRAAAFGADEPLDPRGLAAAAALAGALGDRARVVVSPARRTAETAAALGLADPVVEPLLAECDFGRWAGRTLAEVHAAEPEATAAWMADPDAAPHGGESLADVVGRVRAWLAAAPAGRTVAVTHGGVVKAAVVVALGAPLDAFWRVDVAPLSLTELSCFDGRWTLSRVNAALTPAAVAA